MIKAFLVLSLFFMVISACRNSQRMDIDNSYKSKDLFETNDCKLYIMLFAEQNEYLFRYTMNGVCQEMDEEICLKYYKKILEGYANSAKMQNSQKAIIELYSYSEILKDEIILITEEKLNVSILVSKKWEGGFEMTLTPKKMS